jgi:gliding motility-associated lipoprotein GldH
MSSFRFKILLPSLFAAMFFMVGCNRTTVFTQAVNFHDSWPKEKAARFMVPVKDTLSPVDFYINIRHTGKYRYSNLYLFMQTRFPNGTYTKDTLEIMVADVQGKWLGKGWGEIKEDHVLLKRKLRFPMRGDYEFLIWQAMRVDTLKAIRSVGIDIEKVK